MSETECLEATSTIFRDPAKSIRNFNKIKQDVNRNKPLKLRICKDPSLYPYTYPYVFAIEIGKHSDDVEYKEYDVEPLLSEFISLVGPKADVDHQILIDEKTGMADLKIILYVDSVGREPISEDFIKECVVKSGLASSNDVVEVV